MEDRRAAASTSRAPLLSRTWCWSASTTPATAPPSPSSAAAGTASTRSLGPTSPYPSATPPLPRCCAAASRASSQAPRRHVQSHPGRLGRPWLADAAAHLDCLKAVHLRRMVLDDDALLLRARGHVLHTLRLDKCSGFSTHSLRLLARSCRCLRTLFLEESNIMDHDGEWLRELAINNSVLETLNFYMTDLRVASQHLELLTRNCRSLVSLKISDCDVSELPGFFQAANALQEFGRGSFPEQRNGTYRYHGFNFPPRLTSLGLLFMGTNEMPTVFPVCAAIRRLDLQYTFLVRTITAS